MRNIMYSLLAVTVVISGLSFINLAFAILMGVIAGLVVFLILTRKVMKELEEINQKAQKAIQQQKIDRAIKIYESALELRKKSPFVTGQVYSLIGMLYYVTKDFDKAVPALMKSSNMNWMAKGMLAAHYLNTKNIPEMDKALKKIVIAGKKDGMSYALAAFCYEKLNRKDEAIKVLEDGNKYLKEQDERLKANLLELKNGRKMKMKLFGDMWYQFLLETPPARRVQQQPNSPQPFQRMKKNAIYG